MMSMLVAALKFQLLQLVPIRRSGAQSHRKNPAVDYKCLQKQQNQF